jgi:hypothetical protein
VSPILDPATRTAPIEIEIPNSDFRLKPGMYARVSITTNTNKDALVVPANAVVDLGGRRGVFTPVNESAIFRSLQLGTETGTVIEVLGGLTDGDTVITTGAGALRDGDRIVLPEGAGGLPGGGSGRFGRGGTRRGGAAAPAGAEPSTAAPASGPRLGGDSQGRASEAGGSPQAGRLTGDGRARGPRVGENGSANAVPSAPPS